jgi:hypothetical protein
MGLAFPAFSNDIQQQDTCEQQQQDKGLEVGYMSRV